MTYRLLGQLPDDVADFSGTAEALAETCNRLMPLVGLEADQGSANERLVRHYVQIGVLSPPERQGREAIYGVRQVCEFLAARRLLTEGWPLAKIGELVRAVEVRPDSELEALRAEGLVDQRPRKPAEETLQRIRDRQKSPGRSDKERPAVLNQPRSVPASPSLAPTEPAAPAAPARPGEPTVAPGAALFLQESGPVDALRLATNMAHRRGEFREGLKALGNESGEPDRRLMLRIRLTPWCHVDIAAGRLGRLTEEDLEVLGNAFTHALREERIRRESRETKGNKGSRGRKP